MPRLVQAATLILIVTATTVPAAEPGGGSPFCLFCGDRAATGFLLNIALFVPLGLVMAWSDWSLVRTTILGAGLSLAVECAQRFIPGRHPAMDDVMANTIGACLGAALWLGLPTLLDPRPPQRARLLTGAAAFVAMTQVVLALLMLPAYPRSAWFGQWASTFTGYGVYRGAVLGVTLDGVPLPDARLENSMAVRDLLARGGRLEIRAVAGPAPPGPAPLFSLADDRYRSILMVLVDGETVIVRYRSVAERVGLTPPQFAFTGAFRGVRRGDTVAVALWRDGGLWCLRTPAGEACRGFTAGALWRLVAPSPVGGRLILDAAWMALLFVPLGFWGAARGAMAGIAVALLPMALLPALHTGMVWSLLILAGGLAGAGMGRVAVVAWTRHSLRAGTGPA